VSTLCGTEDSGGKKLEKINIENEFIKGPK
jgi:hypothetical protein